MFGFETGAQLCVLYHEIEKEIDKRKRFEELIVDSLFLSLFEKKFGVRSCLDLSCILYHEIEKEMINVKGSRN